MKKYNLNSGFKIPAVGLGTWQLTEKESTLQALNAAYDAGYRAIDTATAYHNEQIIGEFLKNKKREEIFITTKLWVTDHDRVREACCESIDRLGVEYLDLYLIHWPVNTKSEFDLEKLWCEMESLVETGKVRSIGVANFGVKNLSKLLKFCKIKPAMNQIELHPYLPQDEILEFCKKHGIQVTSYSSLGSSGTEKSVKNEPVIIDIAKKYSVTPSTVLLSFCLSLGCCVIPRSKSPEHIRSNYKTVELSPEDMSAIKAIKTRHRYTNHKAFGPNCFD
ncbi:glycerol 2-dehydrogenase (NADP+) [Pancytospora epiphaga]|nr:glycerol 2-dehydrogenase (NADP+) [Pancytospora epiphaga]